MPGGNKRGAARPGELSDDLVLAAVERAERHTGRAEPGVLFAAIVKHLGPSPGSMAGRWLRPRVRALVDAGLLEVFKRREHALWTLTDAGRERLAAARRSGELGELPESPQHRAWREARSAAGERVDGFRGELRGALAETAALLGVEHASSSEAWFALGERLGRACYRLGSATHCLGEWAEPDDAVADVDVGRRRGRRNPQSWG